MYSRLWAGAGAGMFLVLALVSALEAQAAVQDQEIKEDSAKVTRWNRFVSQLLVLSRKTVAQRAVRKVESDGRYGGMADRGHGYHQVDYVDANSGRLISRVQWDRDKRRQLQEIEVYIYDAHDRVMRDYLAAYLPGFHHAPIQTAVNLHRYNRGLHAFRQFDASGVLVFEKCTGNHNGHAVDFALEDYEIDDAVKATPDYRACFAGLPHSVDGYLPPR